MVQSLNGMHMSAMASCLAARGHNVHIWWSPTTSSGGAEALLSNTATAKDLNGVYMPSCCWLWPPSTSPQQLLSGYRCITFAITSMMAAGSKQSTVPASYCLLAAGWTSCSHSWTDHSTTITLTSNTSTAQKDDMNSSAIEQQLTSPKSYHLELTLTDTTWQ